MSNDQSLDAATLILILKEVSMSLGKLSQHSDQDYSALFGPLGINLEVLTTLPKEEIVKLTGSPDAIKNLETHPFTLEHLKSAATDLLKEAGDLDNASFIAPHIEKLIQQLESTADFDQQAFEETKAYMAEAFGQFVRKEKISEDILSSKRGMVAALDQMHEDEFSASTDTFITVMIDLAVKNGVDIGIDAEKYRERALKTDIPKIENPQYIENPDSDLILASRGQRITPEGQMTEVEIEKFAVPSAAAIIGYQLEKHTQNQDWQALERFEESAGSLKDITDVGEAIDALKELGQQKYGSGHRLVEYTNAQGKDVHRSLSPRLEADLRSGKIQNAVITTPQQADYPLDDEMGQLSVTIVNGEVVNIGDGMEDRIPESVLKFAASEAQKQGIALTVQAQRTGDRYSNDPEYRLLDDNGNEVAIGIQWKPDTDEVYVINDPDVVELTGPANGSSGGSTVFNKADGPEITNRIEIEDAPQAELPQEQTHYLQMSPTNISELAHMVETGIEAFHNELLEDQSAYKTINNNGALNVAHSKFLDTLHNAQASGDDSALSGALADFRKEYGAAIDSTRHLSDPENLSISGNESGGQELPGGVFRYETTGHEDFNRQLDDIQHQINRFYINHDIKPSNLISPEREAYEAHNALGRQGLETFYEMDKFKPADTIRDVVGRYKTLYDQGGIAEKPIEPMDAGAFNEAITGNVSAQAASSHIRLNDIHTFSAEEISQLSDEDLQSIGTGDLSEMAKAIDPGYQKFQAEKTAEPQKTPEATSERQLQSNAPGLGGS